MLPTVVGVTSVVLLLAYLTCRLSYAVSYTMCRNEVLKLVSQLNRLRPKSARDVLRERMLEVQRRIAEVRADIAMFSENGVEWEYGRLFDDSSVGGSVHIQLFHLRAELKSLSAEAQHLRDCEATPDVVKGELRMRIEQALVSLRLRQSRLRTIALLLGSRRARTLEAL